MPASFPLIVPKAGHTRDAIEQLFHERRLKPNVTMELDSSELLKRFVVADVGIGFIARSNVEEDVRAKFLAAIQIGRCPGPPRPGTRLPQRQSSQPGRSRLHRHCRETQIHTRTGPHPEPMRKSLSMCCCSCCRCAVCPPGGANAEAYLADAGLRAPVDCYQGHRAASGFPSRTSPPPAVCRWVPP